MNEPALHYEMIRTRGLTFEVATAGTGDKLALLLHGFPECAHSWRHQIPVLVGLGYRVWAPNLRGYGNTDRPIGVPEYTPEKLEGDVHDLIEASGAKSVLLVGHDWGGAIAWLYATYGKLPIDRLIVMNCPHPVRMKQALLTYAQLRRSWYMVMFQLPYLPEFLVGLGRARSLDFAIRQSAVHRARFSDELIDYYRTLASRPGALTAMINYYRAMAREMFTGSQRHGTTIKKPTLLIWGEQDVALGKELVQGTERFVDDLTIRYVPDASHWVQQDAPETVNTLLVEWLERGSV